MTAPEPPAVRRVDLERFWQALDHIRQEHDRRSAYVAAAGFWTEFDRKLRTSVERLLSIRKDMELQTRWSSPRSPVAASTAFYERMDAGAGAVLRWVRADTYGVAREFRSLIDLLDPTYRVVEERRSELLALVARGGSRTGISAGERFVDVDATTAEAIFDIVQEAARLRVELARQVDHLRWKLDALPHTEKWRGPSTVDVGAAARAAGGPGGGAAPGAGQAGEVPGSVPAGASGQAAGLPGSRSAGAPGPGGEPPGSVPAGASGQAAGPPDSVPAGASGSAGEPLGSVPAEASGPAGGPPDSVPAGASSLAGGPSGSTPAGASGPAGGPSGSIPAGAHGQTGEPPNSMPAGASGPAGEVLGSVPAGVPGLAGGPLGSVPAEAFGQGQAGGIPGSELDAFSPGLARLGSEVGLGSVRTPEDPLLAGLSSPASAPAAPALPAPSPGGDPSPVGTVSPGSAAPPVTHPPRTLGDSLGPRSPVIRAPGAADQPVPAPASAPVSAGHTGSGSYPPMMPMYPPMGAASGGARGLESPPVGGPAMRRDRRDPTGAGLVPQLLGRGSGLDDDACAQATPAGDEVLDEELWQVQEAPPAAPPKRDRGF